MSLIYKYSILFLICFLIANLSYAQKEFFAGDYGTFNTFESKQLLVSAQLAYEHPEYDYVIKNAGISIASSYSPTKNFHTNFTIRYHPSSYEEIIQSFNETPIIDLSATIGYYTSKDFTTKFIKEKQIDSKVGLNLNLGYQNISGQYSYDIKAKQNSIFFVFGPFIKMGRFSLQVNYRTTMGHTYAAEVSKNFNRSQFILTELENNPKIYISQNLKLFYHIKNGAFYIARQATQLKPVTFVEDENHWEYFYNPTFGIGYEVNLSNLIKTSDSE